jgi:hypothetical protein
MSFARDIQMRTRKNLLGMFVATILVVMPGICDAKEKLTQVEYEDRFAYEFLLEKLNLQKELMQKDNMPDGLYSHFTNASGIAIITLDRAKSKEAYRGLAHLLLIQTDGSLSRDLACTVLGKGMAILPYLEEARRSANEGKCVIDNELKMMPGLCLPKAEAIKRVDSYIESVKKGKTC